MLALRMRSSETAVALRCGSWVVVTTSAPRSITVSRNARPSAAPSSGSVAELSSSIRTRLLGVVFSRISLKRTTWPEKLERCSSIDWLSPRSAYTASKKGTTGRSVPGNGKPVRAQKAAMPRVLSSTVLPPVLGPVRSSVRTGTPKSTSLRMIRSCGSDQNSSGCAVCRSRKARSSVTWMALPE
jgi:hypothetical protein